MKHILKNKSLIAVVSSLPILAVIGCNNDEPAPTPDPPAPQENTRTVLVYMVATNNLGSGLFDKSDLDEMQVAATNGDIKDGRLLVYHASDDGVVLKEVTAQGIDTLQVYDNSVPSVSVARMSQVIDDVKSLAPAKDYGMVFWSHATGWIQDGIEETPQNSPMLYSFGADGMRNPKKMNITAMASALRGAGMSYLYFDCCYMGSMEVMYELRDCADFIIASPTEDPANGMPYDLTVKHMFDSSKSISEVSVALAQTTFNYYNDVFEKGDCPCTMSVISTQHIEGLAKATRDIYEAATYSYIIGYPYQKFQTNFTCYYFDFGDYIESLSPDPTLLYTWKKALDDVVIYADATPWVWSSFPIDKYSGLSTFIMQYPTMSEIQNYNTLSWFNDVAKAIIK